MTTGTGYFTGAEFDRPKRFQVCIIGSGAGGAVVASQLANAGFEVIILEEGSRYSKADFKMREDQAYPALYQEAGTRMTKDLGIAILQGRAVGGTTVVNWTTSFRTPEHVLDHWKKTHAVGGFDKKDLDPHWDAVEERLNIKQIPLDETNRNNRLLYDGCKALGIEVETTFRNTRNCFKSGYCGMGCPVDAKQAMHVTYLPDAVEKGATIVSRCRVDRLEIKGGRIAAAECTVIGDDGYNPAKKKITVVADRFILSAGAIGTPAIMMRSGLSGGLIGRRTYLHPVVGVSARFAEPVNPFWGAPQSVASHAFAKRGDEVGYFLEAAPLHPMLMALATAGFGEEHAKIVTQLPHLAAHIAIMIDGFHPDEPGGSVEVRSSGAPILDYPIPERIWTAARDALKTLVRIDLAAGAQWVRSSHDPALVFESEKDLAKVDSALFETARVQLFSAHVMGGAMMGDDPARSVVRSDDLRFHEIENLFVVDGSVLPTSLGVNPQETIYGIAHLMGARYATGWRPRT